MGNSRNEAMIKHQIESSACWFTLCLLARTWETSMKEHQVRCQRPDLHPTMLWENIRRPFRSVTCCSIGAVAFDATPAGTPVIFVPSEALLFLLDGHGIHPYV